MSGAMTSLRRTVASQQAARMSNGLLHIHTFVVSGFVKGSARLLLIGQQDAAAGVDHAAVALGEVLGNVLGLAALCAVAGDQEEAVLILCTDLGGLLDVGAADDQTDGGVAVLAHVVLAQSVQLVAHQIVDVAAVCQLLILKVLGTAVGGAAEYEHTLALLFGIGQVGADGVQTHIGCQRNEVALEIAGKVTHGVHLGGLGNVAALDPEQLARVPHYFVGTLQLTDYYSAAQYEADVLAQLEILYQNHDTVILTGGSMMYIDAICKGIDDIPTVDNETRQLMLRRYEQEGLDTLCAELRLLDPEYYKIVDLKNPKRVIHALEICYMTGKTYTSFRTRTHKERPFRIIKIGLTRDREELYDRINRRVDIMMQDGLLEEARQVYPFRHLNSLNTVGYKEMFKYLDGEWTLEFAIGKIKQNSRIYSRKQMTWFKRDKDIVWFHPDQQTEIMQYIHSVNH